MKRGPESKLTREVQRYICKSLEKCNSIKTAMESAGLSERVFFNWMKIPSFAAAVSRARAKAKAKLVKVIVDAAPKDWRASAFLLARTYPSEYGQRVEITETAEEPKTVGVNIFYDTGGQGMDQLLNFPIHPSMMQHERELEQANVNATETTDDAEVANAPEISDAPPKVVDKRLTGRIRPEWKSNNGQP